MAIISFFSLTLFLFLIATAHIQSLSHASPLTLSPYRRHQQHLGAALRQSTGRAAVTVQLWCVAKNNAENAALQSALDWACGPGGADCGPIQQGGRCYDPVDIRRTASYAFNDYFLKHGLTEESCSFDDTAALTSLNPSHGSCKFPSSTSASNGSFTGSTTTVGIGPASADISGGAYVGGRWCWAFIAIHLLLGAVVIPVPL